MSIYIDPDLCAGCGACVSICPHSAISIVNEKAVLDVKKCNVCQSCITECPEAAISLLSRSIEIIEPVPDTIEPENTHLMDLGTKGRVSTIFGSALVFMTQKIIPVVVDSLIDHFDKKVSKRPEPLVIRKEADIQDAFSRNSVGGNGRIRQRRYRHRSGKK